MAWAAEADVRLLQAMLRYLGAAVQSDKAVSTDRSSSGKSASTSAPQYQAPLEASIHGGFIYMHPVACLLCADQ